MEVGLQSAAIWLCIASLAIAILYVLGRLRLLERAVEKHDNAMGMDLSQSAKRTTRLERALGFVKKFDDKSP